jgi:TatD DNase family protein
MNRINLHTHHQWNQDSFQVRNVFAQDLALSTPDFFFSSGIHPWHIESVDIDECLNAIEKATALKNFCGVGECGIDRSIKTSFAIQESVFLKQVRLAENCSKPLIIHCVRAYSDLVHLKKVSKFSVPWIIHGFNGNMEVMKSLIRLGFYLSIGKPLLNNPAKRNMLREIPTERLFLETDDNDMDIASAYTQTAQLLGISEEMLIELTEQNFIRLFGNDKLVTKD